MNYSSSSPLSPEHHTDNTGPAALREQVRQSVHRYLHAVEGQACNVYALVLEEVEMGLFSEVLSYCRGNQSRAAKMLGIHRATLRKKLRDLSLV